MAFVPGYEHDVFVSYAHGDNREWVSRFAGRLESELKKKLGDAAEVWLDTTELRATRDYRQEIPDSVTRSAVFLLLPSPPYLRSQYCVEIECQAFADTLSAKRARFTGDDFANEQYALRCPIEQVDNNLHWRLFPGLSDIPFFDASGTYAIDKPKFNVAFSGLAQTLVPLLKRMRNRCTPVFLYPLNPEPDLKDARESLANELADRSYRLLPENFVGLADQLREASLAVFLVGEKYDKKVKELAEVARQHGIRWVVWCSPTGQATQVPEQMAQLEFLEQMDSPKKTYLNANVPISELKEEVRSMLNPDPHALREIGGKRRVYLIYKSADRAEKMNAGRIATSFDEEFHFDHPDDPAQHTSRLIQSAGVLLLWGNADQDWCSHEFEAVARSARVKGLCVFDPKETKSIALEQIREKASNIYIAEQFGKFERSRLEQFFDLIRRPT
jgi:TIR domain